MSSKSLLPLFGLATLTLSVQATRAAAEPGLLACKSGIACVEIFDEKNLAQLEKLCDSPFWDRVESCTTEEYPVACIGKDEYTFATWWTGSASCSSGMLRFTDREAVKALLKANDDIHEASLKTTSITEQIPDVSKYCHVTLKETWLAQTNFTARLDRGSVFFVERYESPFAGNPARFVIPLDRGTYVQGNTVPVDRVESNCSTSYIEDASFKTVTVVVRPMKLYADEAMTQDVCTLQPGTEANLHYSCAHGDVCSFGGDALQKLCGVNEAYGYKLLERAIVAPQ